MANLTLQNIAVAKLYTALFNRAPDAAGFAFWLQGVNGGASLASLAQTVLSSPEALAIYPASQTNAQFVNAFYTTVFGRMPDAEGLAFWSAALETNGGAGSAAARAALVMQITDIVSTPLPSKPAGMSDAAYNQTVADRAMFANKIEFGVYFATEVKSNDLALAKSTLALVTDNLLSMVAATKLALGIVDPVITPPTPEPVLALSSVDTAADINTKLATYAGTSATVNATSMTVLQLAEVALGISKIAASGISGDLVLSNALNDTQLAALLGAKTADAANVQVDAGSMVPAKLIVLSDGMAKIDGITGNLALTNDLSATQLGNLLGAKTSLAANVVVDASSMVDSAKLGALVTGIAKVDAINNLSLDLGLAADDLSVPLLDKAGTGARVVTTGASTAEIAKLVDKISSFATGGLSGSVTLTAAQLSTVTGPTLNPKLASGFSLTVLGDAANDVINLSSLTQGVKVAGGAGVDTISVSGGSDIVILGTQAETHSLSILATDTDTLKIDKINNFARTDKIQLSTAEDAYGTGITFSSATVLGGSNATFLPQLTLTDPVATFADIFVALNSGALGAIAQTASTNAVAQVAYIYFSNAGSSLKGGYLVINNQDAVFDQNDTIISLSGALLVGNLAEITGYKDMFIFV